LDSAPEPHQHGSYLVTFKTRWEELGYMWKLVPGGGLASESIAVFAYTQ